VSGLPPLLAVIPARGGSKRVPAKNVRPLNGKPAIQYTIDAALESGLFERIIVSTDDQKIADLAVSLGAEAPFLREAALADDHTPVSAVTIDTLVRLDPEFRFRSVCQLMPNCPLRNAQDIRDSYHQFSSSGAESQISITAYGWLNPWWAVRRGDDFKLEHVMPQLVQNRSQDLPQLFCPTGAVWWADCEALKKAGTFHTPDKRGWEIPWQRAIDIDSEEDWKMTETLLQMQHQR
jgi:CMP-N-acetylneuraminic acid synthetase